MTENPTSPFLLFADDDDIWRASEAADAAWARLRATVPGDRQERERVRLDFVVASLAITIRDHE